MNKPTKNRETSDNIDPRTRFIQFCKNFPIEIYNIPRPLKSLGRDLDDFTCVIEALRLLGVPHEMPDKSLEPIGWIIGPHLLDTNKYEDYSLAFCDEPLKSTLNTNPWLLLTESPIQLAVAILKAKCDTGNPRESKYAKNILNSLGLKIFISKSAQKSRSSDLTMRFFHRNSDVLVTYVKLYEIVIRQFWNPPYKGDKNRIKEDMQKAFDIIFKDHLQNYIIEGEKENSSTNMAISFISFETAASFKSLKKLYYDQVHNVSITEVCNNLDYITNNIGEKVHYIEKLKLELSKNN